MHRTPLARGAALLVLLALLAGVAGAAPVAAYPGRDANVLSGPYGLVTITHAVDRALADLEVAGEVLRADAPGALEPEQDAEEPVDAVHRPVFQQDCLLIYSDMGI